MRAQRCAQYHRRRDVKHTNQRNHTQASRVPQYARFFRIFATTEPRSWLATTLAATSTFSFTTVNEDVFDFRRFFRTTTLATTPAVPFMATLPTSVQQKLGDGPQLVDLTQSRNCTGHQRASNGWGLHNPGCDRCCGVPFSDHACQVRVSDLTGCVMIC